MDSFFDLIKIIVIANSCLIALWIILLNNPESRLRRVFFRVYGIISYSIAAVLGLYVVSPIDILLDVIPVVGQIDDVLVGIFAIGAAISGYFSMKHADD